ncbi:MAG: DUF302 domain-containing protein [Pseudomonadales bacterium]|nr:DUF302 domain-containing protein [Pseudomonadales bacterium]
MNKSVWLVLMLMVTSSVFAVEGMVNIPSKFSVAVTAERFESILNKKGMTIFAQIKHSESAAKVGISLRETELFIFGNPKAGSPLMKCEQSIALDLPQKALIWKDENSAVWISYNALGYLLKRHDVKGCEKESAKISRILDALTTSAAGR